ncbi:MAG TPA: HEAT repeat domain-containing protein [Polyangiaceae bacterium]
MSASERLRAALGSGDPEERRRATTLLSGVDPERAAEGLTQLLGDEDWRVRKEAVAAAAALAPAPSVLKALVGAFGPSENVGLRNAAVEALATFGVDAVDALAAALAGLDADGRKLAVEALARTAQPSALPVLQSLLRDPDPNVCVAAVEGISALGAAGAIEVVPVLVSCLDAEDGLLRLAALDGLGALGVSLSYEKLTHLASDQALEHAVLAAAGRTGDERAADLLVGALPRSRGGNLLGALRSIVELARSGRGPVRALQRAAAGLDAATRERLLSLASRADDNDLRVLSLLASGALGLADAPDAIVTALADETLEGVAEEALDWLGSVAVLPLVQHGRQVEAAERASCIDIAARLADADVASVVRGEALSGLSDAAPEVVRASLGALAAVGDESCLGAVAARLGADNPAPIRRSAETSLAVLAARFSEPARSFASLAPPGSSDAHAAAVVIRVVGPAVRGSLEADVEFLSASLSSPAPSVRRASLEALAAVGGDYAVEPLSIAVADEVREVRLAAVRALGRLRSSEGEALGLPQLVSLIEGGADEELRVAALIGLGETGDLRALPILRPLVRSGDPKAAVAAIEALGAFPESRRVEALIDGLSHSDGEVVKAALRALGESHDARVLLHLGASLDHAAWDVRRLAADLLGRQGESAAGPLRARLGVEEDPLVREAIGRALERMVGRRSLSPTRGSYRPR